MNIALSVHRLCKVYSNGFTALHGIDLEIAAGEFFGLIGANGAGKSTLVGILTGLIQKTGGKAALFGIDIDINPYQARQYIGVVPQEFNFNIFEKPENILIHQAGYFGIGRNAAKERAEELLRELGLWGKHKQEVRRLSGGMKRRLMIARALIHRPKLLLLDEPTAGVDVEMRHSTWEYLRTLNTEGTTILLTSHYLEEIEQLCPRAAMIQKGSILKVDTVQNMIHSLDEQVYHVQVNHLEGIDKIIRYRFVCLDDSSLEVVIGNEDTLTHFITTLDSVGIVVKDLRPKRNRLEQLFLNANRVNIHDS